MDWKSLLATEKDSNYFKEIIKYIDQERKSKQIYPKNENIFKALELVKPDSVKVVILGQDPYHGPGQANGLAFSVPNTVSLPPSLKNIFKELENDVGVKRLASDLSDWASQGVLLLNTSLTVEKNRAGSHSNVGWSRFTDAVITIVAEQNYHCVFILWGNHARKKKPLINSRHSVIESAHPSPLSAYSGFFGSKPFSRANTLLSAHGQVNIVW